MATVNVVADPCCQSLELNGASTLPETMVTCTNEVEVIKLDIRASNIASHGSSNGPAHQNEHDITGRRRRRLPSGQALTDSDQESEGSRRSEVALIVIAWISRLEPGGGGVRLSGPRKRTHPDREPRVSGGWRLDAGGVLNLFAPASIPLALNPSILQSSPDSTWNSARVSLDVSGTALPPMCGVPATVVSASAARIRHMHPSGLRHCSSGCPIAAVSTFSESAHERYLA